MRIAAVQAQEPLSGVTVLLENTGSEAIALEAIKYSRQNYGAKADAQRMAGAASAKPSKVQEPKEDKLDIPPRVSTISSDVPVT